MSNHKMSIVFYVNGMKFEGDSLDKHSLGGSETAGLCMAREMAKRGHDVVMFCNTDKPGEYDGVKYLDVAAFHPYTALTAVDVCIVQRIPQVFKVPMKSKLNILWQHDLATKPARGEFRGSMWNFDEVWGVSAYHVKQMSEVMQVDKKLFWQVRNGIDEIKIDKSIKRNPKRLIYTARPERGMDTLLFDIMPKIWEQDPEVELHLAGYDNTVEQMRPFYDSLQNKIKEYQAQGHKVRWLGSLTKKQLYREYQAAAFYVYPTNFEEVSCITAMECMANGLPMITSNLAALPETLDIEHNVCSTAILIKGDARSEKYQESFVDTVIDSLKHFDKYNKETSDKCVEFSKQFSWSDHAAEWEQHLYEMFAERTQNKDAIARQFYRNEDIMALKQLFENNPKLSIGWEKVLSEEYPIIDTPDAYRDLYVEYGKNFKKKIDSGEIVMNLQPYTRVQVAMAEMGKPKKVLDYGCAVGNEAIQMVNAFDCEVTAVNISPDEMAVGRQLAEKYCKTPHKIDWHVADSPNRMVDGYFDTIFAGEIIEHVVDPTKLIQELEAKCAKGGKMVFTVPLGPWGDTYAHLEQRGHLWSFDRADIKELFGKKKDLSIKVVGGSMNDKNKEMLGWYVISYTKTDAPTGQVNLNRKLALQAPRQTVSACMIIGGAQEGLLHRCLKSIYDVVDEIIIMDTGMSAEATEIATHKNYANKVRIFVGPNPLEVGFDEARNISLEHATKDWILWIDSDEELLTAPNIFKYLRRNGCNGYSIRQHHFSAQPPGAFKTDLPVRLFRNGLGAKFYGMIHEHPELELNAGMGNTVILSDVDIAHDGYLTEEGRRNRFDRNLQLMIRDREKYPDRVLGKFLMMRDWIHLARYNMEGNGNQVTPQVAGLCNKVIGSYKQDFLGKDLMMSHDGLEFYSEALSILGRGMEYAFNINVKLQGAAMVIEEDKRARFDTPEDFKTYLDNQLKAMHEPYEGGYA